MKRKYSVRTKPIYFVDRRMVLLRKAAGVLTLRGEFAFRSWLWLHGYVCVWIQDECILRERV